MVVDLGEAKAMATKQKASRAITKKELVNECRVSWALLAKFVLLHHCGILASQQPHLTLVTALS